ncbi:prepilin-type N-terminal cleavage/methylation domain-containing protein [Candidatus Gracilibacteria bacterium 28_42_T64]|nr:prepilin-type N-terminal cleavage/methylation domain-containing protein [Candidatus Gracilibacteria bacterium 28_42_T64]
MRNTTKGFTIVELIVVITILAILGTIAFLSLQGYSKKSRNSVRSIDVGTMKQALGIFVVKTGKYPQADNAQDITYSGALVFSQGVFGDNVMTNLGTLSHKPVDPLLELEYNYSVSSSRKKYEIGGIMEGDLFSYNNNIISETNALSNNEAQAFVAGEYDLYDMKVQTGSTCYNLAIPSMMITDVPAGGILSNAGTYKFSYNTSLNIPTNFQDQVDTPLTGVDFTISEVLNSCSVTTLSELNSYISKLSLAYQTFNGKIQFDQIIFHSLTTPFQLGSIEKLKENGIKIGNDLVQAVNDAAPDNLFSDTFGTDEALLSHVPDTLGSWTGASIGSYSIVGNKLRKISAGSGVIPLPSPAITSADTILELTISDFQGGDIKIYSRYVDANNYYVITLHPTNGYNIERMYLGSLVSLDSLVEAIPNNSTVKIIFSGISIELFINDIPKSFYGDGTIMSVGNPIIELSATSAEIDDYKLLYK